MPGLSRSGTTIATGLLLGNEKGAVATFSFLMVLAPILGETLLSALDGGLSMTGVTAGALAAGFISADKLPAESHESLMEEVQAGFNMYCDHIAKSMYDGRTVSELTEEEKAKLDEAIPFQFTGAEETPAEAEATTEAPAAE
jgi:hypothetical protein